MPASVHVCHNHMLYWNFVVAIHIDMNVAKYPCTKCIGCKLCCVMITDSVGMHV
jgi:hypothetical protein